MFYTKCQKTIAFTAGRGLNNQPNQALSRIDGAPTNISPFISPFDGKIYYAVAINNKFNSAGSWRFEVDRNGNVGEISITIADGEYKATAEVNVSVSQGDELVFYMRGQSEAIDRPVGTIYLISD